MSDLTPEVVLLRKALKWALDEGIYASHVDIGSFYSHGCGCCSDGEQPPEDVRALVLEIQKEILGE